MKLSSLFIVGALSSQTFVGFVSLAQTASDRTFDDRPEFYFRTRPSFKDGRTLGHISTIKREEQLVLNGGLTYTREDGKLNDWVSATYDNQAAWLHSRGARAVLSRLGVADPARELKRVTTPRNDTAVASAAPGPQGQWQSSYQTFSYSNRAPAAQMPRAGFHNGSPVASQGLAPYQGLNASTGPLASGGGAAPSTTQANNGKGETKEDAKNPAGMGQAIPICVKSKAEYDDNKILQKAFEGSKNPFTAWADPANDASLAPNGQGQWDFVVKGALLKTLPIQICVEKAGTEPYLSLWNKRFDIKDNGTVQTVYLEDVEGKNGTFTQQALPAKQKSTSKSNTVQ